MKKIGLLLFLCMCSLQIFAKVPDRENDEKSKRIMTHEKAMTAEIQDCRFRGGYCKILVTLNGHTITLHACCADVQVVIVPAD